jgi:glycosyltransferase involved in cell wall biosynthesis
MKILVTCDPHLPVPPGLYGGIERIVDMLLAELRRHGHTVALIAHPESTAEVDFFRPWPHIFPKSKAHHVLNTIALQKCAAAFQPDIVHSFSRLGYMLPLLPRKLAKIMSYERLTGGRQITIAARLARKSLVFTGCSSFIAEMGRPSGGRWMAIPNFVDTNYYTYTTAVKDDAPLAFLSRVEAIKGAHIAIEVAKRTGRRLIVAGNHGETGADGDYWSDVIVPELGRNRVEYCGPVDDAAKGALLREAAAMIVPIQWDEPFGIVFAEALACGTPVIGCPRGALPEIVRQGVDGFLVSTVDEACAAVRDIGTIDRRACRAHAEECFSVSVVVPQYEALYRDVVERL